MQRIDFIQHASRLGIPYIDMTEDEWAAEKAASELCERGRRGREPLDRLHADRPAAPAPGLFTTLLVPSAVARETAPSVPRQPWDRRAPADPAARPSGAPRQPRRRRERSHQPRPRAARRPPARGREGGPAPCGALGLNVIGTLGVLLAAKRKGVIPAVRPLVEALLEKNFWISPQLVERALTEAGEGARP